MPTSTITMVPIDQIKPFLDRESDRAGFNRLVKSIERDGIMVPINLRAISRKKRGSVARKAAQRGKDDFFFYEHIDGHRRRRACEELGIDKIPAILRPVTEQEQAGMFYIENEVRSELSAYDKAELMQKDLGRLDLEEIAEKYNMRLSYVRQCLGTVQSATTELHTALRQGSITLDEARSISRLDPEEQLPVLSMVEQRGLKHNAIDTAVIAHKKASGDKKITKTSIMRQLRTTVKGFEDKKNDRDSIYQRYQLSAAPLRSILKVAVIRKAVLKSKIDISNFYEGD
jgi:ParB/RepB/Spo0J family partition protein